MISLFDSVPPALAYPPIELMERVGRSVSLLAFLSEEKAPLPAVEAVIAEPEFVVDDRAERLAAMVLAARHESAEETRVACELEAAAQLETERERMRQVARDFAHDRARYFAAAESQVVRLALAVARRVLEREVEVDPEYLRAIVRAALARVQDGSTSTLRVAEAEGTAWSAVFTESERIVVVADERVAPGTCLLETSVGRVELGLVPQIEEISSAFNALAHRQGK